MYRPAAQRAVSPCGTDGGTKAKPPVSPSLAALLSLKTQQPALQTNGLSGDSPNQTTLAKIVRDLGIWSCHC